MLLRSPIALVSPGPLSLPDENRLEPKLAGFNVRYSEASGVRAGVMIGSATVRSSGLSGGAGKAGGAPWVGFHGNGARLRSRPSVPFPPRGDVGADAVARDPRPRCARCACRAEEGEASWREGRTGDEWLDDGSCSASWPLSAPSSIVGGGGRALGVSVLGDSSDELIGIDVVGARCWVRFSDDVVTSARAERRGPSVACRTAMRGISVDEEGEWEEGGVPAPVGRRRGDDSLDRRLGTPALPALVFLDAVGRGGEDCPEGWRVTVREFVES
jgi:hypothetical protein